MVERASPERHHDQVPHPGHELEPGVGQRLAVPLAVLGGDPLVRRAVAEQHRLRDVGRVETPRPQRVAGDVRDHAHGALRHRARSSIRRSRSATPGPASAAESGSPTPTIGTRASVGWSSIGANAGVRAACALGGRGPAQRVDAGPELVRNPRHLLVRSGAGRARPRGATSSGRRAARARATRPPADQPATPAVVPGSSTLSSSAAASSAARSTVANSSAADRVRAAVAGPVQRPPAGRRRRGDRGVGVERAVAGRGVAEQHDRRVGRGVRGQVVPGDAGGRRAGRGVGSRSSFMGQVWLEAR